MRNVTRAAGSLSVRETVTGCERRGTSVVCQRERRGDVHVNAEPLAGADVCRAAGRVQLGAAMRRRRSSS